MTAADVGERSYTDEEFFEEIVDDTDDYREVIVVVPSPDVEMGNDNTSDTGHTSRKRRTMDELAAMIDDDDDDAYVPPIF
jgi:hypothetical protein